MPLVPEHIFREYDIRGLAETELTPQTVRWIGQAYGTYLVERGVKRISVGGDIRLSTERIKQNIVEGVLSTGIDVIDIGVVATPCFYWSLFRLDLNGGVMVTGSHNPKEFNGLKLAYGKTTLYGEEIQDILKIIENQKFSLSDQPGKYSQIDLRQEYIDMLVSKIQLGPRKLYAILDAGNGTAGLFAPAFLDRIGCRNRCLFEEPDGHFPNHHPDPTKREYLQTLIETVLKEKADLGIAFDGDADRIGVVDDKGEVIWGDRLMILYWMEILPKHPGAEAIVEVKSSMALPEAIERLGGKPLFYKAGHSLIKAKMKEINALFAGEVSGHMFFADEYFGFDDAFYAAGRLLRILSNTDRKLSEIMAEIPVYYSTAETRIPCPDEKKFDVVEKIRDEALKDHEAITIDGVRIFYPNGWGLVRASNTQPVLVARCEGRTKEDLEAICRDVKARMLRAGVEDFEWEY